jgi:hypothetical protein
MVGASFGRKGCSEILTVNSPSMLITVYESDETHGAKPFQGRQSRLALAVAAGHTHPGLAGDLSGSGLHLIPAPWDKTDGILLEGKSTKQKYQ